jgi:DNA-binding NtrC family response regulator
MNAMKRILIVDDEPNVRLVFRTTLESTGYQLATAENGETALNELLHRPFDLVLLDLQMPGMDGMTVLQRLRDSDNNVPVVIVTAHGSVPNAVQAMKLGAIDFLCKPLAPDALRSVVAEVLERHAPTQKATMSRDQAPPHISGEEQFQRHMTQAKRALNRRAFDQAEVYLKQAIGLDNDSADAHNLMGVLHELRNEHDESYREYRASLKANRHYEPAKHNMTRYYERFTFGRSDVPIDIGGS